VRNDADGAKLGASFMPGLRIFLARLLPFFDALGHGNAVVAAAAAALTAAASRAMQLRPDPWVVLLAAGGTLVIYGLDRLRDVARDGEKSPLRTAWVERHRGALVATTALGAAAALAAGIACGVRVMAVAAVVAALGLAHRRIKHWTFGKPAYLILTWTAVPVALPLARAGGGSHVAWVTAVLLFSLWSNVILSNLKDHEAAVRIFGPRIARRAALCWSGVGVAIALAGPASVVRLAPIPVATLLAVLGFRRSERYAAWAVDGALLAGALVSLLHA
jgi:hypothetical protein